MNSDDPQLDEPGFAAAPKPLERPAAQFSIRAMLLATAAMAALCCIFFVLPPQVGATVLLLAICLLMPATLAALVYGRGWLRAFAVGATPPLAIVFLWISGLGDHEPPLYGFGPDFQSLTLYFVVLGVIIVTSGLVGQTVYWWCSRQRRSP